MCFGLKILQENQNLNLYFKNIGWVELDPYYWWDIINIVFGKHNIQILV